MSNHKSDVLVASAEAPRLSIPTPAQLVLDFFDNELADVKFADMDRGVLQEALEAVQALAEEQARAEAALRAAQESLQVGLDGLLGKCQRALAYARIYAEDDADLSRRLEAIVVPRRARPGVSAAAADPAEARGKRGRPRAAASADREDASGTLFVEAGGEAAEPSTKSGVRSAA